MKGSLFLLTEHISRFINVICIFKWYHCELKVLAVLNNNGHLGFVLGFPVKQCPYWYQNFFFPVRKSLEKWIIFLLDWWFWNDVLELAHKPQQLWSWWIRKEMWIQDHLVNTREIIDLDFKVCQSDRLLHRKWKEKNKIFIEAKGHIQLEGLRK